MPKKIKSIAELQKMAMDKNIDTFILLDGGARSSKTIFWDSEQGIFYVDNDIDGTEQKLTPKKLNDERYTNVGKAIKQGAFYSCVDEEDDDLKTALYLLGVFMDIYEEHIPEKYYKDDQVMKADDLIKKYND